MRSLPVAAQLYIMLLSCLTVSVAVFALHSLPRSQSTVTLLFALLIFLAELWPTVIRPGQVEVTLSGVVANAAIFLFPWPVVFLSQLLATLVGEIRAHRPWYKKVFNTDLALVYALLGASFRSLFGDIQSVTSLPTAIMAVLYMIVGFTVLNTSLVTLVVALAQRTSPMYVWRTNAGTIIGQVTSMPILGLIFAVLWSFRPWALALVVLPLWVVRSSFVLIVQLRQQTERALLVFADAVDARDPMTYHHSQRVADTAVRIAREMSLPQSMIDTIHMSARLHDLGKVGITDRYLYKPGPLTADEMMDFRRHASLGAEMVKHFTLFNVGEEFIRGVHERYDGRGYPDGKTGEQTPLGARIIAVADAYDAMTSRRPYRDGLPEQEALHHLLEGAGTQFDPYIVEAALRVLGSSSHGPDGSALANPHGAADVHAS